MTVILQWFYKMIDVMVNTFGSSYFHVNHLVGIIQLLRYMYMYLYRASV